MARADSTRPRGACQSAGQPRASSDELEFRHGHRPAWLRSARRPLGTPCWPSLTDSLSVGIGASVEGKATLQPNTDDGGVAAVQAETDIDHPSNPGLDRARSSA